MRAWLSVCICVCLVSVVGCGGDNRGSLIKNTVDKMSEAATALTNIKDKVADFKKKKESGKDEEGAKKDLDAAIADAQQLERMAKEWQTTITRATSGTPVTDEEKAKYREKNQSKINDVHKTLIEAHREMKKVVAETNATYEEAMRPLMQELNKAEGEFAVVVRKK